MNEEIVRVVRVLEYVGTRSHVEQTVAGSIHGEGVISDNSSDKLTIKAATIGSFSELLQKGDV